MDKLTKDYRESLLHDLQNPEEAAAYLTAALEEGDSAVFLLALRNVADAKGMSTLAAKANLTGHSQFDSVSAVLSALDLRLAVTIK